MDASRPHFEDGANAGPVARYTYDAPGVINRLIKAEDGSVGGIILRILAADITEARASTITTGLRACIALAGHGPTRRLWFDVKTHEKRARLPAAFQDVVRRRRVRVLIAASAILGCRWLFAGRLSAG